MKVKRKFSVAQLPSSQNAKDFRTFLLVQQLAAKEIGARIAQARREAGLSQDELAELVDVSKRSLQNHEAGVHVPYKHLRDYSEALNRPVGWFLHGDPEQEGAEDDGDVRALADEVRRIAELRAEDRAATERLQESIDLLLRRIGEDPSQQRSGPS